MPALLLTLVRYAMFTLAGILVSRGLIEQSVVEPLVGLGTAVAALIWYLYGKYFPERRKKLAEDMSREPPTGIGA